MKLKPQVVQGAIGADVENEQHHFVSTDHVVWSAPVMWAAGTAMMLMCMIAVDVVAQMSEARLRTNA